jgi:hypothetical protein
MISPDDSIWILGAGGFGRRAVERLVRHHGAETLAVVDSDRAALEELEVTGIERVHADAVDFLWRRLRAPDFPRWIVPAVPVHIAFAWIYRRVAAQADVERRPVPEAIAAALPNPMRGPHGEVYASYADFICPDDCPEPADHCTVTGKPRPTDLFRRIASLAYDGWRPIVVRSRQMAAGVGGYSPAALFDALVEVQKTASPVLLATACRCHGVVDALVMRH